MTTAAEFIARAEAALANYPEVATLYRVKDPRVVAQIASQAAMLALYSQEQQVAAMEPFSKARDVTVLADGAVKGVLPLGTGQRSTVTITNTTATPFTVSSGRRLLDPQGRVHVVSVGATVPAQGSAVLTLKQEVTTVIAHSVTDNVPFYAIAIPAPATGYITGVAITDSLGNVYSYQAAFANTPLDARIYNLETDETRQLSVRLGASGLGGYQPSVGEVLNVSVSESAGDISLSASAPFVFEHAVTVAESGAKIVLSEVLSSGSAPMTIETMREVTSNPSLYDDSSVYLSDFDFLLRRKLPDFRFLSVWNERIEESVRGAKVANMNKLFVAALMDGEDVATLRADIVKTIARADDSYRVAFVAVAEVAIPMTVRLQVPPVYDLDAIKASARDLILGKFGRDSDFAKRGRGRILYRKVVGLIEDNVAACQVEGADIQVSVTDTATVLPETYRYVSPASLTLIVEAVDE